MKDLQSFISCNILISKKLQIALEKVKSPDCFNKLALMVRIMFVDLMSDSAFADVDSIGCNVQKVGDGGDIKADNQKTEYHVIFFF